jgi:hypothetical protein
MGLPLAAFCSVLHMGWTFCCWSAILNTCGHPWMYSALYFTWVEHSVVDLQYLWTPLDAFCSVLHMGWTFCCHQNVHPMQSTEQNASKVVQKYLILQISNRMINPCEVQSRIHPDILLLICNTCGHLWMYSALYYTWVGHSVVDLQYLWTLLDAFCSVPHMDWTFCCWSAILVDILGCIPHCTSHGLDILLLIWAEYIQRCPQVLQINNRMSKLCEV